MGKSAAIKKIRKLASQLPTLTVNQPSLLRMKGSELIEKGIEEITVDEVKVPVNGGLMYESKQTIEAPMNHRRNMKKLYNKFGQQGIDEYIKAMERYQSNKK